jgi:hypothetical protein
MITLLNVNALTTVAMLSAITYESKKDYLGIISPFFCDLLPARGEVIDLLDIQYGMQEGYGFVNIPIGALSSIAMNLSRCNDPICEYVSDYKYRVIKTYDNSSFRTQALHMNQMCDDVANALKEYMNCSSVSLTTTDTAKSVLLLFFDQFGYHVLKNDIEWRDYQFDEQKKKKIAKFIQEEREKKSLTFRKIIELARGYMVFRSIYFFARNDPESTTLSLQNVIIYLDTPLIIDLLCFDTNIGWQAVTDAINLAKGLGAKVKVMQQNIEEVSGIIAAYKMSYPNVQSFHLQNIKKYRYSLTTLDTLSSQEELEKRIAALLDEECDIVPGLGCSVDWGVINSEEALARYYHEQISTHKQYDSIFSIIGDNRTTNDIRSLTHIQKLRDGSRPRALKDCKAFIVSHSKMARNAIKYIYEDYDEHEINFVYGLNDFSCWVWLANPSSYNMAQEILLYNAASCLIATDSMIKAMFKYVDQLVSSGVISSEKELVLHSTPFIGEAITDIFDNGQQPFSQELIEKIYDRAIEIESDRIIKTQYEPQIDQLQRMNDELRNENIRLLNQDNANKRKPNDYASKRAAETKQRTVLFGRILSYLLFAVFIFLAISSAIPTTFLNTQSPTILLVVSIILSISFIFDLVMPKMKFVHKLIVIIADHYAEKRFRKEKQKAERYYYLK